MRFYTPLADRLAPLQRMKAIALRNGWQASAGAIERVIDEIKSETF
jgi:hypothetical protein